MRDDEEGIDNLYKAIMYSDVSLIDEDSVLRRYVNVILDISQNPKCYIDGKNGIGQMKFIDILSKIMEENGKIKDKLRTRLESVYDKAVKLLCDIRDKDVIQYTNARSGWLEWIEKDNTVEKNTKDLAKFIIFLCYNYVVEDGIKNVCKRYTMDEQLQIPSDYISRISQYLKAPELSASIWKESQTAAPSKWMKIKLTTATHILDMTQWLRKKKATAQDEIIKTYDDGAKKELLHWRILRVAFICLNMVMAFVYGVLLYYVDWLSDLWKDVIKSGVQSATSVFSETAIYAIVTTVTLAVVMAIYKMLKKMILKKCKIKIEIPDFAESFFRLLKAVRDIFVIIGFKIEMFLLGRRKGK